MKSPIFFPLYLQRFTQKWGQSIGQGEPQAWQVGGVRIVPWNCSLLLEIWDILFILRASDTKISRNIIG